MFIFNNIFTKSNTNINTNNKYNIGIIRDLTPIFKIIRIPLIKKLKLNKSRLICRLDKLIKLYLETPKLSLILYKKKLEQNIVIWDTETKFCKICYKKSNDNCRLCGNTFCSACLCEIPISHILKKKQIYQNIIICKGLCLDITYDT